MRPILSTTDATLLLAMPPRACPLPVVSKHPRRLLLIGTITDCELWEKTGINPNVVRAAMFRLQKTGMVRLRPAPMAGWQLTARGERRQLLLQLLPGEAAALKARGKSGGDNFLAEADCRPGPSRAMYPASVLQGRGG